MGGIKSGRGVRGGAVSRRESTAEGCTGQGGRSAGDPCHDIPWRLTTQLKCAQALTDPNQAERRERSAEQPPAGSPHLLRPRKGKHVAAAVLRLGRPHALQRQGLGHHLSRPPHAAAGVYTQQDGAAVGGGPHLPPFRDDLRRAWWWCCGWVRQGRADVMVKMLCTDPRWTTSSRRKALDQCLAV